MSAAGEELSALAKTVAEMRALGVSEYRSGDVHIVLGAPPAPPTDPVKPLSDAELKREMKRVTEYRERMLYASSEGFDDEVDLTPEEPDGIPAPPTEATKHQEITAS